MEVKVQQSELSSEIGRLLRKHFGKGPEAVFVTIASPYVIIYLRHFLSPIENMLLEDNHTMTVEEIRDKMMRKLHEKIKEMIHSVTGLPIKEFYYDWAFENGSGLLVGVEGKAEKFFEYNYPNRREVETIITKISAVAEKHPDITYSHMLNDRTLIVIREGILVQIEEQLIELGFEEALTLAKRKLEKKLLLQAKPSFQQLLQKDINEIFVNWDFSLDKSIIVFILSPQKT
ncbi:MAG: Na-translocating system protein MpsC family protein [Bacillota bacterium]|nr:Na-translocating system protein MpsC family protein [Bacillota bacterium]